MRFPPPRATGTGLTTHEWCSARRTTKRPARPHHLLAPPLTTSSRSSPCHQAWLPRAIWLLHPRQAGDSRRIWTNLQRLGTLRRLEKSPRSSCRGRPRPHHRERLLPGEKQLASFLRCRPLPTSTARRSSPPQTPPRLKVRRHQWTSPRLATTTTPCLVRPCSCRSSQPFCLRLIQPRHVRLLLVEKLWRASPASTWDGAAHVCKRKGDMCQLHNSQRGCFVNVLAFVAEGEQITEVAISKFMSLFHGRLPDITVAALRALFQLDCDLLTAVEDALVQHGGEDGPELQSQGSEEAATEA